MSPWLSYLVAWAGSLWILFLTWTGRAKPLPGDLSLFDQVLRPIVLTQVLFVSYNFLSSIFFFADIHGWYYFTHDPFFSTPERLVALTAEAQRYYVLAHGGIAFGMLAAMDYRRSGEWAVRPIENPSLFLLVLSGCALVASKVLGGGLGQIGGRLQDLSLVASVFALAVAIPTRRSGAIAVAGTVYLINLASAFASGWKEHVLVMVILLAVFAYPYARRTVLIGAPIILISLLTILPTFANIVRGMSWYGTASGEEAAAAALETIQGGDADLAGNNWRFLTNRISEIGLFIQYIASTEDNRGFYGAAIVQQSAMSLVPRLMWSDKPITEVVVMQRVYENGVVGSGSDVSAKPQYVVDGYLSSGAMGVLAASIVFGLLASLASRVAERWFGGYWWGSGLVFTTLFAVFWKGNSFEFFFNSVFWGFVLMIPLFFVGRATGYLVRHEELTAALEADEGPDQATASRGVWAAG